MVGTERAIKAAAAEGLPICLLIAKFDRCEAAGTPFPNPFHGSAVPLACQLAVTRNPWMPGPRPHARWPLLPPPRLA